MCWSEGPDFLLQLLTSGMADGACPSWQAWVAAGVSQGHSVVSRCNDRIYSSGLFSRTQQDAPAKRSVSKANGFRLGVKHLCAYSAEDALDSVWSWGWRAGRAPVPSHGLQGLFDPQWACACSWGGAGVERGLAKEVSATAQERQ